MEVVNQILAVCGGISILGTAVAVIWKWVSPAFRLNKRVEILEEHDKEEMQMLERFNERDSLIMQTLIALLDSHLGSNSDTDLKKTRDKLTSYLVQNQS